MKEKALKEKLDSIKTKLKEAHDKGNSDKINYYLQELNTLWEKASIEMLSNARKDGFIPPQKN